MKKNFWFYLLTASLLICQTLLFADSKIDSKALSIIKKMEETAGADKIKTVKNMTTKMKMEASSQNISGETETIVTKNKFYSKTTMMGHASEQGYNGTVAWSKDMMQGVRELSGQEKEACLRATLNFMENFKTYFTEISLSSDEKFLDKDCYVLICKKQGLPDIKMFVNKEDFSMAGMQFEIDTPQGNMTVKSIFESYKRLAQGFSIPEKMVMDAGMMKFTVTLIDVKVDSNIDEKIFDKPAK